MESNRLRKENALARSPQGLVSVVSVEGEYVGRVGVGVCGSGERRGERSGGVGRGCMAMETGRLGRLTRYIRSDSVPPGHFFFTGLDSDGKCYARTIRCTPAGTVCGF